MSSKVTAEQIVKALRCSASTCVGCPYSVRENLDGMTDLPGGYTDADGNRYWGSCDCDSDKLMQDAADLIEELMGRPTTVCNQHGDNNYCIENCGTLNL